jgi:hypothetical protein
MRHNEHAYAVFEPHFGSNCDNHKAKVSPRALGSPRRRLFRAGLFRQICFEVLRLLRFSTITNR